MNAQPPPQPEPLLVVILGPTASGKSALAIQLAQEFAGEIVSCDSVALYRYFEIGTAKPTREQRALVPHHLLDVAEPDEPFTAGEYARQARAIIDEIARRGHLPIVVGGTGLYLRALLEGLFPGPQRSEDLRQRLRASAAIRGSAYLHRLLTRLDPEAASKIHANDLPKLVRAIEVCLASRAQMSELWKQRGRDPLRGFQVLRIGLNPPREKLYERINQRAARMFEDGLIEETRVAAGALRREHGRHAAGVAWLQAGGAVAAGRTHARTGYRGGTAGPSQLRQAADDLVSPRAGCRVARWLRGRSHDRQTSCRIGFQPRDQAVVCLNRNFPS